MEIIVVDDASDQVTLKLEIDVRYFRMERRSGSPAARNFGAAHAKGKYLFFLDDDMVLSRNYLEELIRSIEADEKVSAVAGRIVYVKNGTFAISNKIFKEPVKVARFSGDIIGSFDRNTSGMVEVPTLHGAAWLVDKQDFQRVGGFDAETYRGNYYREETDLSFRLREAGKKLLFNPEVVAYHVETGVGGQRYNLLRYEYFVLENHAKFLQKFFGRKWPIMAFFFVFRRIYERSKQLLRLFLGKLGLIKVSDFTLLCELTKAK